MKNIVLVSILLSFFFASCNKDASVSNKASFKWTYSGATFSADTVIATKADSFAGVVYPPQIYAQTGPWSSPQVSFTATINSLSPGTYGNTAQNMFIETGLQSGGYASISPFSLTITSASNNMISGNYTGTLNGQTITGSFSNVAVH